MRAFAVLMMVQGHTVDALLGEEYRNFDSVFFSVWHTLRGFTAPIFMFTSGVVFTYLLMLKGNTFNENPRVWKGIKRFLLLVGIGYLLRYPTWRLVDFRYVTEAQWHTFFAVDALHLIGIGLLFILIVYFISDKIKVNFVIVSLFSFCFILVLTPKVYSINWNEIVPLWIADYLTNDYGSLFPLFPWLAYMFAGSILGYLLAKKKGIQRNIKFSVSLMIVGAILVILNKFDFQIIRLAGLDNIRFTEVSLVFLRLGVVLILNGFVSFLVIEVKEIPTIVLKTGANTLPIYVVHLIILYGSAWSPGLWKYVGRSFSLEATLLSVILMFIFVILLVMIIENSQKYRRKILALIGA